MESANNLLPIIFSELDKGIEVIEVDKYNSAEKKLLLTLQQQFHFSKENIQLLKLKVEQNIYIVLTPELRKTQIGRKYVSRIDQVEFILMTPESLIGLGELMSVVQEKAKNREIEFQETLQTFLASLLPAQKTNFSKLWGMIRDFSVLQKTNQESKKAFFYRKQLKKIFNYPNQLEEVTDFLVNFFQKNYNVQISNAGLRQTRISEKRRKIKKNTLTLMENSSLKRYFSDIEFDNEVTRKQLKTFENEVIRLLPQLPQTKSRPALKLRKLGRFHAQGIYLPNENIIAIDFRKRLRTLGKSPFSSFIHEYGHYLDYQFQSNGVLSNQRVLQKIRQKIIDNLNLSPKSYVYQKKQYYLNSTELFARLFELYIFNFGICSTILDNHESFELDEYKILMSVSKEAINYFKHLF